MSVPLHSVNFLKGPSYTKSIDILKLANPNFCWVLQSCSLSSIIDSRPVANVSRHTIVCRAAQEAGAPHHGSGGCRIFERGFLEVSIAE